MHIKATVIRITDNNDPNQNEFYDMGFHDHRYTITLELPKQYTNSPNHTKTIETDDISSYKLNDTINILN